MSALVLQNNTLWHIFEDFTASILLSACFLIYVIRNQFSNHPPIHDNKIANELSARLSEINFTFTAELDRINNDLNNKLNEVNAGFGKINTELNGKLTAEA